MKNSEMKSKLGIIAMFATLVISLVFTGITFAEAADCDPTMVHFYSPEKGISVNQNFNVTLRIYRNEISANFTNATLQKNLFLTSDGRNSYGLLSNVSSDTYNVIASGSNKYVYLVNFTFGGQKIMKILLKLNNGSTCTKEFNLSVAPIGPSSVSIDSLNPQNNSNYTRSWFMLNATTSTYSLCRYTTGVMNTTIYPSYISMTTYNGTYHYVNVSGIVGDNTSTYSVRCRNLESGNYSSVSSITVVVHQSRPILNSSSVILSPVGTNNSVISKSFNLSFNTSEPATCVFYNNGTQFGNSLSVSHSALMYDSDGSHTYAFNCTDLYGLQNNISINVSLTIDSVSPEIISITPLSYSTVSSTQFKISTNKTVASCNYSNQSNFATQYVMNIINGTHHNITVSLPDGSNTAYFRCVDFEGRAATANRTIIVDTHAPVITVNYPNASVTYISTPTVALNVTTNEAATCTLANGTVFSAAGLSGVHALTVTPTENVQNNYTINCTDIYGNMNQTMVGFYLDALKPDLVVTSVANITPIVYSHNATYNVTIRNIGNDNYTKQFTVETDLNGTKTNTTINGLNVSATKSFTVSYQTNFMSGPHAIFDTTIFGNSSINESNSLNNNNVTSLTSEYAAITLGNFKGSNSSVLKAGDFVRYNITVYNNGTYDASDINVSFYINSGLNSTYIGYKKLNLTKLSSSVVQFNWTPSSMGTYTLRFNATSVPEEPVYNDNYYLVSAYTVASPNIVFNMQSVSLNETTVWKNEPVLVTGTVTNNGASTATNAVVQLLVNGTLKSSTTVTLTSLQTRNVSFAWTPTSTGYRNYTVKILNMSMNDSLSDNFKYGVAYVYQRVHNIAVDSIGYNKSSSTVYVNNVVGYTATIKNLGNQTESNIVVRLKKDGMNVANTTIVSLANGTSTVVNIPYMMSISDLNTMSISTDPVASETNLTDNAKSVSVRTLAISEAIVKNNIAGVSSAAQGTNFTVGFVIKNADNLNPIYDLHVAMVLPGSSGMTLASGNLMYVSNLTAGGSRSVTWKINSGSITGNFNLSLNVEGNTTYIANKLITII